MQFNNELSPTLRFVNTPTRSPFKHHKEIDLALQAMLRYLDTQVGIRVLTYLENLKVLNDLFVGSLAATNNTCPVKFSRSEKLKCIVVLLLLISGNVQPNPGPTTNAQQGLSTPADLKNSSGLGLMHINVRSLLSKSKMDMVRIWASMTDADVIVLSETWLKRIVSNDGIAIADYNVFRVDRESGTGGGVVIYVKSKFNSVETFSTSKAKHFEVLAVDVSVSKDCRITIIGCYRPPSAVGGALTALSDILHGFCKSEFVLLGDLNWDFLSPISDPFKEVCDSLNVSQLLNAPTRPNHRDQTKSTLLDVILTNAPHKYTATGIFCNDISDHCVIACVRNTKLPKVKSRYIFKRQFKLFDEQAFLHELYHHLCPGVIDAIPDVDIAVDYFTTKFLQICDKHAPIKKLRIRGRDNPWFSNELSELIRQRNISWAKARHTHLPADWTHFRCLRNKCCAQIRRSKSDFYLKIVTENLNNPSKFWKQINSLSGSKVNSGLPKQILTENSVLQDKADIVEFFNQHFLSAGSVSVEGLTHPEDCLVESPVFTLHRPLFEFELFSYVNVLNALNDIDPKKSAGPDNLDPQLLKMAAPVIAEPLMHIFNLSLISNTVPKAWKSAYVLPLLKGGDPSDVNNYRPISKLSILAKVLESLVNIQLKNFLAENNILNEVQSGFRTGHSTMTAATVVVNDIINGLDKKQSCAAVFVDLSKAFDSVDHTLLLTRLRSSGLGDMAVQWFRSYLTDRTQCVHADNLKSNFLVLTRGVPQGSVLAPILFSIFINDLGKDLHPAKLHLYADDTVAYSIAPSVGQAVEELQTAFQSLQSSFQELKLALNAKKTKFMVFSRALTQPDVSIHTSQGSAIEKVPHYKYLGIWLDDKLSYHVHVTNLIKKLKPLLGFFFRNKTCFPMEARKRLVQSTFLSVLDYGDILYMHATETVLRKLDPVYHASLRFITNANPLTHHCALYQLVGWSSLYLRRKFHFLLFVYKALIGKLPPYLGGLLSFRENHQQTRSTGWLQLKAPRARTELGKTSFSFHAPESWNNIQKALHLELLVPFGEFKNLVSKATEKVCRCFS